MKPIAVVALNVVTVAAALIAYDVLRDAPDGNTEPQSSGSAQVAAPTIDDEALEERLRALESERRRVRRPSGTDPAVLTRLEALEAALVEPTAARDVGASRETAAPTKATTYAAGGDPTEAEIKRFRQLQEAVRRQETIQRNKKRVDAALDALSLNLTETQRATIHAKYAAFQPRVNEIWGEVKREAQRTSPAGGRVDWATIVADTTAAIQQEFAETLSSVVSQPDSLTIAGALHPTGK